MNFLELVEHLAKLKADGSIKIVDSVTSGLRTTALRIGHTGISLRKN